MVHVTDDVVFAVPARQPCTHEVHHLAARMEQLANPGTILLSPATLKPAAGRVEVRAHGPVPIKGLPEPMPVFELTGASDARSRVQASAVRGLTTSWDAARS
jgi:adenylate cyclase